MNRGTLLTVSGVIPSDIHEQIASGSRPRADYLELAKGFNADVLDYIAAGKIAGWIGAVLTRISGGLLLAFACWKLRKKYRAIVTDGEQVGLLLAMLLKLTPGTRPRHLMIVHVLSEPKKIVFLDWLGVQSAIDRFVTYSRWQQRFIMDRWKLSVDRVVWMPFMVDQAFFAADRVTPNSGVGRQICAVGLERRDYETLLNAVKDLDVNVVIAAASPWSKRTSAVEKIAIPANVTVRKFTQYELRQLYADSCFMVMPLQNVKFQAGVTAILECLSMGKPVICSSVPGQTDVVIDGENGKYVLTGDPLALRREIQEWLCCPAVLGRLGANGRKLIEREMNLDLYVQRLASVLGVALDGELL